MEAMLAKIGSSFGFIKQAVLDKVKRLRGLHFPGLRREEIDAGLEGIDFTKVDMAAEEAIFLEAKTSGGIVNALINFFWGLVMNTLRKLSDARLAIAKASTTFRRKFQSVFTDRGHRLKKARRVLYHIKAMRSTTKFVDDVTKEWMAKHPGIGGINGRQKFESAARSLALGHLARGDNYESGNWSSMWGGYFTAEDLKDFAEVTRALIDNTFPDDLI
jgi:hypothetical protein